MDFITAYVLFDNASDQGIKPASYKREQLKNRMSKDQLKRALLKTEKYKAGYRKKAE